MVPTWRHLAGVHPQPQICALEQSHLGCIVPAGGKLAEPEAELEQLFAVVE
jgi:hypothetical protein